MSRLFVAFLWAFLYTAILSAAYYMGYQDGRIRGRWDAYYGRDTQYYEATYTPESKP